VVIAPGHALLAARQVSDDTRRGNTMSATPGTWTTETLALPRFVWWAGARSHTLGLTTILVLALGLRLVGINESLWLDELWSTWYKLHPTVIFRTIIVDTNPPLYALTMFGWIRWFGDSELSIRFIPLVLGLASICLLYRIALEVADHRSALLAAFLAAVSPIHIWYSTEARHYSALIFFVLLSFLAYRQIERRPPGTAWSATYALALIAGVMTHHYVVIYSAALSFLCLLSRSDPSKKLAILGSNLLALLVFIAFVLYKQQYHPLLVELGYLRPFTAYELWNAFFNWFLLGNSYWNVPAAEGWSNVVASPLFFVGQLAACLLFLRGVQLLSRERSSYRLVMTYLFLLPACLLGLTALGARHVYVERSLLVAMPFFYLLLARGALGFGWWSRVAVGALVAGTLCALGLFLTKGDQWTVYKPNADWRSMAEYLGGELQATKGKFRLFASSPAPELTYYDPRIDEVGPSAQGGYNPITALGGASRIRVRPRPPADICNQAVADEQETFYLVDNRYWGELSPALNGVNADPRCSIVETRHWKGLDLYKIRTTSTP
jgi:mannosyltransferase